MPPASTLRRRVLRAAAILLGLAIAVLAALAGVSTASHGEASVLIGSLESHAIAGLATIAALVALSVGLCLIPVRWPWLFLLVPARIVAIAASFAAAGLWSLTTSPSVTPLLSGGCATGYVVQEDTFLFAARGTVYRQDGILATPVARTSGDDAYRAFQDGGYAVIEDDTSLRVWYNIRRDHAAAPVATVGEPALVLPVRTGQDFACGLSTGARTPEPAEAPVPSYDEAALRAGVAEMLSASLAAAEGPVLDAAGIPIDLGALVPSMSTCEGGGTQLGIGLEFSTADNAASVRRILGVWDAAGYEPDRAMQNDMRYSERLPARSLSIRDTTTIDGLVRMSIISACSPAGAHPE